MLVIAAFLLFVCAALSVHNLLFTIGAMACFAYLVLNMDQ